MTDKNSEVSSLIAPIIILIFCLIKITDFDQLYIRIPKILVIIYISYKKDNGRRFQSTSKSDAQDGNPPSRGSEQSHMITPSNISHENKNRSFFKNYNNKFNTITNPEASVVASYLPHQNITPSMASEQTKFGRHSIDIDKQYLIQKKFNDGLNKYPKTRYPSHEYDSVERPNSVSGTIKLRRSQDLIKFNTK